MWIVILNEINCDVKTINANKVMENLSYRNIDFLIKENVWTSIIYNYPSNCEIWTERIIIHNCVHQWLKLSQGIR